jgi:hypothetical protein
MPSKSLEALEELKDEIIPDFALDYEEQEDYNDWIEGLYQTIKQDLERKEELEKENLILEQSVKDTYDTSQEIIADLKEEKERWRKLCLCWREAYIECDEKFHNLCKEVLK